MSIGVGVSRNESAQIEVLRALCITMMMWVHVSPGISNPSFVNSGDHAWIGAALGDFLGRSSVSVLSFVSGYLIWTGAIRLPFGKFFSRQIRTIFLPMVIWGQIFILLLLAKSALTGEAPNQLQAVSPTPLGILDQIVGLTGPTANLSLFFLRDLLASSLILWLLRPAVARWPLAVLCAVLVWGMFLPTAPVVFRPMILLFFVGGAVMARLGGQIDAISRPVVALPLAAMAYLVYLLLPHLPLPEPDSAAEAMATIKRVSVSFLMLAVSRSIVRHCHPAWMVRYGKYMFLCYLTHMPMIGLLWAVWSHLVGTPQDASYLAFYLLAPIACVSLGLAAGRLMDGLPADLQCLLRGKALGVARGPAVQTGAGA